MCPRVCHTAVSHTRYPHCPRGDTALSAVSRQATLSPTPPPPARVAHRPAWPRCMPAAGPATARAVRDDCGAKPAAAACGPARRGRNGVWLNEAIATRDGRRPQGAVRGWGAPRPLPKYAQVMLDGRRVSVPGRDSPYSAFTYSAVTYSAVSAWQLLDYTQHSGYCVSPVPAPDTRDTHVTRTRYA